VREVLIDETPILTALEILGLIRGHNFYFFIKALRIKEITFDEF